MNKPIIIGQFDKCVLLKFGSEVFGKPLRTVKTADHWEFDVKDYVEMNAPDGEELIRLINSLPYDETMRCHVPGFGIEFLQGDEQIAVCSICCQCNNIFFRSGDVTSYVTFDGQSAEASLLLDKFRFAFNAVIDLEDA